METNQSKWYSSQSAITGRFNLIAISFILFFAFGNAKAQSQATALEGKWFLEMKHNDLGFSQIIMEFEEVEEGRFEAHTRKGAINDILGSWNSLLARTLSNKLKGGSLLRIENGIYSENKDSIKFTGMLTSVVADYNIQGFIVGEEFSATLTTMNHEDKGTIKGSRDMPALPIRDYNALFRETVNLTQNKIFNREIMEGKEWKSFEKKMNKVSSKLQDDLEMVFAFYYYAGKLPISHYMLMKPFGEDEEDKGKGKGETSSSIGYTQMVFLEEKNPETGYLKITSFGGSAAEMDSVFDVIATKHYKNLIVDLRNNPGGSVDAGMSFATHVADTTFYGGVFLTQKYFNNHTTLPTVAEYETFPYFTESNYDLLMDGIHNTEGLCLKVVPQEPVYNGNMFILTNGKTGSTCEPIVYGFKQLKRATIVGEATAGAMLAAEMFDLSGGFKMFLPTADYYAFDGYRIDKKGIEPDIKVEGDALEYVMKLID